MSRSLLLRREDAPNGGLRDLLVVVQPHSRDLSTSTSQPGEGRVEVVLDEPADRQQASERFKGPAVRAPNHPVDHLLG
jgi:hypothetical protein